MKNAIKFSALLMVTLVMMMSAGCKKDSSSATKEFMKLTIDGQAKDVPVYEAHLLSDLNIVGSISDDYKQIWIYLPEDFTIGTHALNSQQTDHYAISYIDGLKNDGVTPDLYHQESGSIEITEYDVESGKLTGTFYVKCINDQEKVINITNGSFLVFI